MPQTLKVAVAVSGGMDSLLALRLLKEKGMDVGAVHARFLDATPQSNAMLHRLQATCRDMDVPLHVLDLRQQFQEQIVRPFAFAYASRATPNPCVFCNRRMKFGLLRTASRVSRNGPPLSRKQKVSPMPCFFPRWTAPKIKFTFSLLCLGTLLKMFFSRSG